MTAFSPFVISTREAAEMTKRSVSGGNGTNDNLSCFLLSVRMLPLYGAATVPPTVCKKLPRLVNGIPLGAGVLSHIEPSDILWRYIEGCSEVHTFISQPLTREAAEQTRAHLINNLVKHAKVVFGDVTVKVSVTLSQAVTYDSDIIINDIAEYLDQGMHFID